MEELREAIDDLSSHTVPVIKVDVDELQTFKYIPRKLTLKNGIYPQDQISLFHHPGEAVLIEGVSGMGKTTFLMNIFDNPNQVLWYDAKRSSFVRYGKQKMPLSNITLIIDNAEYLLPHSGLPIVDIKSISKRDEINRIFISVTPGYRNNFNANYKVLTLVPLTIEEQSLYFRQFNPNLANYFTKILKKLYSKRGKILFGTPLLMQALTEVLLTKIHDEKDITIEFLFKQQIEDKIRKISLIPQIKDMIYAKLQRKSLEEVFYSKPDIVSEYTLKEQPSDNKDLPLPKLNFHHLAFVVAKVILNSDLSPGKLSELLYPDRNNAFILGPSSIFINHSPGKLSDDHDRNEVFRMHFDLQLEQKIDTLFLSNLPRRVLSNLERRVNLPMPNQNFLHRFIREGSVNILKVLKKWKALVLNTDHLHSAISENNIEMVRFILEEPIDVNKDINGRPSLHLACSHGFLDIAKLLLDASADVNSKSISGEQPLHIACSNGFLDIAKLLLSKGANINALCDWKETSLYKATFNRHVDTVKELVGRGALLEFGLPVLPLAAALNEFEIVKYLVERGADVNISDFWGKSALHSSTEGNFEKIAELLIKSGADVNQLDVDGYTPLNYAVRNNNLAVLSLLVEKADDASVQNKSLVFESFESANLQVVKFLINQGADINAKDFSGTSLILNAATKGNLDLIKFLIENGVDVNDVDYFNTSAVHYAAEAGNLGVVEYLHNCKADINSKDDQGNTPLKLAVQKDHISIVEYLIESGADLSITVIDVSTVLRVAAQCKKSWIRELLLEYGENL